MTMPPTGQWPPPPQGPPQGPPQWNPQPGPPPKGGSKAKWILGGLALLVVVVVSVVATLLVTRGSSGSTTPTASAPPSTSVDTSDIASANDRGPAGIITEDPTCAAWEPIARTLSEKQKQGWAGRDPSVAASDWTPEQASSYRDVGQAMRSAADQTIALAKVTPHRVMRELYEQSVAYWRAYADALPRYEPHDDSLALVASSTSGAVVWICAAITYGSASARSPLVAQGNAPMSIAEVGDPAQPEPFMQTRSSNCDQWISTLQKFNADTEEWASSLDPNVPASQWSPDLQRKFAEASSTLQENAGQLQNLGALSGNPTVNDFAALAAKYQSAYVQSIPSYVPADNFLNSTAAELVVAVEQACKAAQR